MKQYQTFLHGTYSNLISFSIILKVLKYYQSVNDKGNWAYLAEKNSRPGGKIITIFKMP